MRKGIAGGREAREGGTRWRDALEEIASRIVGGTRCREALHGEKCGRKKNRGWEALEKIARRKCWRRLREGIAGRDRGRKPREEIASAGGNRKWNRGRDALEGSAGGKRWRKVWSQEESRVGSARRIAGRDRWRKSLEKNAREWKEEIAKSWEEIAGGKRWRNRKENRGWEVLDKIARRK